MAYPPAGKPPLVQTSPLLCLPLNLIPFGPSSNLLPFSPSPSPSASPSASAPSFTAHRAHSSSSSAVLAAAMSYPPPPPPKPSATPVSSSSSSAAAALPPRPPPPLDQFGPSPSMRIASSSAHEAGARLLRPERVRLRLRLRLRLLLLLLLLVVLLLLLRSSMRRPVQTLTHRISRTPAIPGSPRSCTPNRRLAS